MLEEALAKCLEGASSSRLRKQMGAVSEHYRSGKGSRGIFSGEEGCLAYLAGRVPATYGAMRRVLQELKGWKGTSCVDLGAGPGTASWAAVEMFPSIQEVTMVEESRKMMEWGKRLAVENEILNRAKWIEGNLEGVIPWAELGLMSYVLGELRHPERVLEEVWRVGIPVVVVVEPGTPVGFARIRSARRRWLEWGGFLVAPCPHREECPMGPGDWCHFATRISRTRLHREVKGGELGYEDEKFSYLILSRERTEQGGNRIVRHPLKGKGHVQVVLCTKMGILETKVVTKKEGPLYQIARDAKWGDVL